MSTKNTVEDATVHWVTPNLPTVLEKLQSLRLPPTELVFASMDAVWIYPGALDVEKFKVALARTLHDQPHAAGRIQCINDQWSIVLSNSAVPVTVGTSQRVDTEGMQEPDPELVDTLPCLFTPLLIADEPLVKFRITTLEKTGDTSMSIAWLHALGDGLSQFRFMLSLHQYYLDLEPQPVPTFEKYLEPEPVLERTLIQDGLHLVPHLAVDYAPETFFDMYEKMISSTSYINLQFSADQLQILHATASAQAGIKVSQADALSAYLITVLNRIAPTPIQQIINYMDYRGVETAPGSDYKPPGRLAAGNVILAHFSEKMPPNPNASMGSIAGIIREGIKNSREPEQVRQIASLAEELRGRSSKTKRMHWWWTYDDQVGLNNLSRVPITSLHFGYPGMTRFYTFGDYERYFRFWPGNPERRSDGSWQSNEGSVRVFFRLKHHLKPLILNIVKGDMSTLGQSVPKL